MSDVHIQDVIIDTQDSLYIHDYYFEERKDNATSLALQVPLLFGYEDYNGFYFLTGLKFNVLLRSQTDMSAKVTTIGTYDRYIDSFHDMPNHALITDLPIRDIDQGIVRNVDVLLAFESGYAHRLNSGLGVESKNRESVFKVALYLEYGFLNSYKANNSALYHISDKLPVNYDAIQMDHIYLTQWDKLPYIQNLSVGCKLTYLFNVSIKKCDHCIQKERPKIKPRRFCTRCVRLKR